MLFAFDQTNNMQPVFNFIDIQYFTTCMWARLDNIFIWIVVLVTLCFGIIGFADDYAKVSKQNTKGVPGRIRLILGFIISAIAAYFAAINHPEAL